MELEYTVFAFLVSNFNFQQCKQDCLFAFSLLAQLPIPHH